MRAIAVCFALALVGTLAVPAVANHRIGHEQPAAPAAQHFPEGFDVPIDHEWDWELGGFGGPSDEQSARLPIVFVHGNNTDHATWYPVAEQLTTELGYKPGDLWGLAYNGVGCTNDGALFTRNEGYGEKTYQKDREDSDGCVVTGNDVNVPDLHDFIVAVLDFTGAERVHIVAHSLGVTVARKTMFVSREDPDLIDLYDAVAGFVAIAGANQGTSFCPPGSEDLVKSCNEIAAGTDWLAELNAGPNGEGETPEPTRWMTVYDGSGVADPAFLGPYADSPRLGGAVNCAYPGFYHNDLRVDPRIVADYAAFLTAVEGDELFTCPEPPAPLPSL